MTSPADRALRDDGFTLIEVVVVLAILAAVAGLVLQRGPQRSAALELRAATSSVAQTLRTARGLAIATNRTVGVQVDAARQAVAIEGGAPHSLAVAVAVTGVAPGAGAAISFAPDGSSSGGQVRLGAGPAQTVVAVDWLTGRVTTGQPGEQLGAHAP